jgi:hypothetical protein
MENSTIKMELNNEAVRTDDTTMDVVDTDLEHADVETQPDIEPKNEENSFFEFLGVCALAGLAAGLVALATREKRAERRYEKLKKKMEKEAAKRGEAVTIAKIESEHDVVDDSEEVESEEEFEN